jgi:hypothetical protein
MQAEMIFAMGGVRDSFQKYRHFLASLHKATVQLILDIEETTPAYNNPY